MLGAGSGGATGEGHGCQRRPPGAASNEAEEADPSPRGPVLIWLPTPSLPCLPASPTLKIAHCGLPAQR